MSAVDPTKAMTARELARLLGVSQSAVSRAFTPGASISADLRNRILGAAERFGYHPNAIASILSRRRSDLVGLVMSDLQNPFYPPLLEKLSRALQEGGQQTLLFNMAPGSDIRQQLVTLRQFHVDALVIVSATVLSGQDLNDIVQGRRAVLVNRVAPDTDLDSVLCDNTAGARAIADHFHAIGRRRIAYVAGLPHTHVARDRQHGFVARIAEHGLTLSGAFAAGRYSYEAGYRTTLDLFASSRPEAIFYANDILAAGGMDALRDRLGLAVPDDVAVAGFDDIEMAGWPHYGLTTYRQPVDAIVATVMHILNSPDAAPDGDGSVLLPGDLIVRGSTVKPLDGALRSSASAGAGRR